MNYNIATNSELQSEKQRLEEAYEIAKRQFAEAYETMKTISVDYVKIQEIINKREGKNTE